MCFTVGRIVEKLLINEVAVRKLLNEVKTGGFEIYVNDLDEIVPDKVVIDLTVMCAGRRERDLLVDLLMEEYETI
jgi:hypothetical protein